MNTNELQLSSWNIKRAFCEPSRAEAVAEAILNVDSDITFLPDAYQLDSGRSSSHDRQYLLPDNYFEDNGYDVVDMRFDEERIDDDYAEYHTMALAKKSLHKHVKVVSLGSRKAVVYETNGIRVAGLYLSDQSAFLRGEQIDSLCTNMPLEGSAAVIGDFNELHGDSLVARTLRSPLTRFVLGRIGFSHNVIPRAIGMADGRALKTLEKRGFRDADSAHRPTMPSKLPVLQLDHHMVSADLDVTSFTTSYLPACSDHGLLTSRIVPTSRN